MTLPVPKYHMRSCKSWPFISAAPYLDSFRRVAAKRTLVWRKPKFNLAEAKKLQIASGGAQYETGPFLHPLNGGLKSIAAGNKQTWKSVFTLPVVAVLDSCRNKRNLNTTLSSYRASVACRFLPPTSGSQKNQHHLCF